MASTVQPKKISVPTLVPKITKPWSPKLLANLNGEYDIKVARLRGSYIFHAHPNTDELFYILEGTLLMKLKEDGNESTAHLEDVVVSVSNSIFGSLGEKDVLTTWKLNAGDVFNVPRGVRHCPVTQGGDVITLLVEMVGTLNSGDANRVEGLTNEVEDVRDQA